MQSGPLRAVLLICLHGGTRQQPLSQEGAARPGQWDLHGAPEHPPGGNFQAVPRLCHPDRDPLPLVGQDQRGGPILQADARLPEGLQHLGDYFPEVHSAAWGWGVPISSNSSRMTTRSSKGRFSPWISW